MLFRCKCDMMSTLQKLPFPGMNAGKRSEIKGRNPMNLLILTSIILSVILGVGRMVDLALFTDAETGLCVVGSVWLRYAALAVAILLAVAAGRAAKPEARKLCSPCKPSGVMAILGAVWIVLAGVAKIFLGSAPLAKGIWGALAICCGGWLCTLGRGWLQKNWKRPADSLTEVVLGSALFYWCVLARFMENSSSWHRVAPTVVVWQMLAALVFLSVLGRALSLPDTADSRTLCASGLTVWALCLCWEFPQLLDTLLRGGVLARLPDFFFGLGLCCIGVLGGICAVRTTRTEPGWKSARHSVG